MQVEREVSGRVLDQGGERGRGWFSNLCVKGAGPTRGRQMILQDLSNGGGNGILGVAVKCVEFERNTRGEGGFLDIN